MLDNTLVVREESLMGGGAAAHESAPSSTGAPAVPDNVMPVPAPYFDEHSATREEIKAYRLRLLGVTDATQDIPEIPTRMLEDFRHKFAAATLVGRGQFDGLVFKTSDAEQPYAVITEGGATILHSSEAAAKQEYPFAGAT